MQSRLFVLTLVVSLVALGVAAYAITGQARTPTDTGARLDDIDARLDRMEAALRTREEPDVTTLVGLGTDGRAPDAGLVTADPSSPERALSADETTPGVEIAEAQEQIQELVDEAVAKKAAQIRHMQDKKPSIDAFAEVLALNEAQREIVEREVLQAQHDIRALLDTPTADGSNLLDELVEVFADGMAHPGENPGLGMKWFGRVMTEVVPGTSQTYAERAEGAKTHLRETLRRELSEEQYALFEAWEMDPSEIEDVPGSPWKDVELRVRERAKDLGATIPEGQ